MTAVDATALCPRCKTAARAGDRFCSACGCSLASQSGSALPDDPHTGNQATAGFADEDQVLSALHGMLELDPEQRERAMQLADAYHRQFPQGRYIFDVLVHGEIARAIHSKDAFDPRTVQVDPSFYRRDANERFTAIVEAAPQNTAIRELRTGVKFRHEAVDAEMLDWARQNGIESSPDEIDEAMKFLCGALAFAGEDVVDKIVAKVKQSYEALASDSETGAQRTGSETVDIRQREEAAYRLFAEGKYGAAKEAFQALCELAPENAYAHAMQGACLGAMAMWERELEEELYALTLDRKNDFNRLNLLQCLRCLGMYGVSDYITRDRKFARERPIDGTGGEQPTPEAAKLQTLIGLEETFASLIEAGRRWCFVHSMLSSRERFQKASAALQPLLKQLADKRREHEDALEHVEIFVSYRRADASETFERLVETLPKRLGGAHVFRDVVDIQLGHGWLETLEQKIRSADAVLACIGRNWTGTDPANHRRLDNVTDVLRRELAFALKCGMPIVPVFFDGAAFPAQESLPTELRPLALTQGLPVTASTFDQDLERLASALHRVLKPINDERRKAFALLDEAAAKNWKIQFGSGGVDYRNFHPSGKWACRVNAPQLGLVGELNFTVAHDFTVTGDWSPRGKPALGFHGTLSMRSDGEVLEALVVDGLTVGVEKFHFEIPVTKRLGPGYEGQDATGGRYYLELIERYRDAL